MPVRLVRPWTDSEKVDSLGDAAEVFFLRLIMCADDYGRFTADPRLLKAALYPLRDVRVADMSRLLQKCAHSGLIAVYNGADGKPYAAIKNFGQRMRAKTSKYPAPPDELMSDICPSHDSHLPALDGDGDEDVNREISPAGANAKKASELMIAAEEIAKLYPKDKVGIFQNVISVIAEAIQREMEQCCRELPEAIATVKSGTMEYAEAVKLWKNKTFISTPEKFYNSGMYNHDPETFKREAKGISDNNKRKRFDPADPTTWPTE